MTVALCQLPAGQNGHMSLFKWAMMYAVIKWVKESLSGPPVLAAADYAIDFSEIL